MDFVGLLADFAQLQWLPPHHIPALNEDEVERLYQFEERLMNLPVLHVQDFDFLFQAQGPPPPVQDPRQIIQLDLTSTRLPQDWQVYEGMNYFVVEEEEDHEVWEEPQNMEEEEEQEEDLEEEIIVASNASEQVPVDVSLSTKRRDPISSDMQLLRDIKSSAEPHIPTIGLQELTMPDYASPVFVPTLEPRY